MHSLDVARWQFGITTVYHFLFVPLSIGLSFLVAGMQTAWVRTGHPRWYQLTRLYGQLFLINIALGVVTGIVQEFQLGMNWSAYSRFVGDVFGAPLALESLAAFFLESTFIGLWIFGWDRLPRRIHLATIWIAAFGSLLSAYFILAANSWMQHPVGYRINPATGRAQMTDVVAVFTNKVALITLVHTLAGAFLAAGALVAAVALWRLMRGTGGADDSPAMRTGIRLGSWVTLASGAALAITGDTQGKIMTDVQPMKMAAAEALYHTASPAPFSILTVGSLDGSHPILSLELPRLLSFLATGNFSGRVQGIDDLQAQYQQLYGPGSYTPSIPVTYWTFRLMVGVGMLAVVTAAWALYATRRGRTPSSRWLLRATLVTPLLPLLGSAFGWIFTEMGRQPWIVFGQLRTADGVSPGVSTGEVITSLTLFTLLYVALAVIETRLLLRYARAPLTSPAPPGTPAPDEPPLAFAY
ncbi:cytochrome ubiquinol oxidase subunit I [Rugosimonospora africana]|uniref:Cytochrome ubiquinol oxidase subunit I n=1 Tax=Rugosimonospora africana TaxID=556532 RepID=A0A8J3R3P7_9ACTN|nr:cytochrome ubiquinol oxidase subunit I [Rugosimonospora africana]GIH20825.1 cytochrome ubiquinol oxidase subunit I [Rugosimonospora africana]